MKTIGTEEHFVTEEVVTAWSRLEPLAREDSPGGAPPGEMGDRLREVGDRRIGAMDEAGLDVQVISLTSPGLHNLPAGEAARLQVDTNDRIAAIVNTHPDRFQRAQPRPRRQLADLRGRRVAARPALHPPAAATAASSGCALRGV
jgi:predicted TIM-barrel fold metal-dependent hydrolase